MTLRVKGSCRFEPYYKAQYFDETVVAWRDVQRQFPSPESAQTAFKAGHKCRVMRVTMEGRTVL